MLGLVALLGLLALGLSFDAVSSDDSDPAPGPDPETGNSGAETDDDAPGIAQQLASIMQELGNTPDPDAAQPGDAVAGDDGGYPEDGAPDDTAAGGDAEDDGAPGRIDGFDPGRDVVVVEVDPSYAEDPEFALREGEDGLQILSLDGVDIARIDSLGGPVAADMVRFVSA